MKRFTLSYGRAYVHEYVNRAQFACMAWQTRAAMAYQAVHNWACAHQAQMHIVTWYLAVSCFIVGLLVVHVTFSHAEQDKYVSDLDRTVHMQLYNHSYLNVQWQTLIQGHSLWQRQQQWGLRPPAINDIRPLFEDKIRVAPTQ